jgi:hypothetical protein
VPIDGSQASIRALKLAIGQLPKASFIILNVQNPATLNLGGGGGIMPSDWIAQKAERATRKALQEADAVCREAQPFQSAAILPKRSIAWPKRRRRLRFSWGPEDWAGCAVSSSARRQRSYYTWSRCP